MIRRLLALTVAAVGLLFVGAASGDTITFNDALLVSSRQSPDTTLVELVSLDNGLIANVELDMPAGYSLDVGQPAGTPIANFFVVTRTLDIGQGQLSVADPAAYTDAASVACDAQPHIAVWAMTFAGTTPTLTVPWFVDAGANGGYVAHVCFPASQFGSTATPVAALLVSFSKSPLHAPTTAGSYLWRALVTPFGTDGQTPDVTANVEYQSVVPVPVTLTMKGTYNRHTKFATVNGRLTMAGAPADGYTVDIGTAATRHGQVAQVGTAQTSANGTFSYPLLVTRSEYVFASPEPATPDCTTPTTAVCSATEVPAAGAATHVVVPRPPEKKR